MLGAAAYLYKCRAAAQPCAESDAQATALRLLFGHRSALLLCVTKLAAGLDEL